MSSLLVEKSDSVAILTLNRPAAMNALSLDLRLAFSKAFRDIQADPACLNNLANDPAHAAALREHRERLESYLRETGDPRILDGGDVFETYPRYSPIREFPKPEE